MSETKKSLRMALWIGLLVVGFSTVTVAMAQPKKPDPKAPAAKAPAPAEVAPRAAREGEAAKVEDESLLALLFKGGWVMIPIGLCSIAAIALAVERFLSLRRSRIAPLEFMDGLKRIVAGDSDNTDKAVQYCDTYRCAMSEIMKGGIRRMRHGYDAMEKGIEDAGAREVYKLKRSLRGLLVIGTIAPLLGLLGTVYGLITAFQNASKVGVGKAEGLAKGIYEAMVTTASGLTLAIPVLIIYQILASRVDGLVDDMDEQAIEFLEYTLSPASSVGGVPPVSQPVVEDAPASKG